MVYFYCLSVKLLAPILKIASEVYLFFESEGFGMKKSFLSFIGGFLLTVSISVVLLLIFSILLYIKQIENVVLWKEFFTIYNFRSDASGGFEFNIIMEGLIPFGIIGGILSIGLKNMLTKGVVLK
ncbi:hypothetical protein DFR57_102281 [Saliterribacillus persicus]|uniref:Uncharacterized protein n=2 Tax=Saliterribacillus persicus TaxID=930114 RepID=A0A368YCD6_9BACI|nr:hypothetical protein DFR57_102281 [Saliterribacillus persicus]